MDPGTLINHLIQYLGLLVLLTFHEFGHAWMALRCGDQTAYAEGRVSLNPLVHIDPIGTVVMPLLGILFPGGFFIGWAKPVPVNPYNLRNPKVDDILVTLAGPWMNLLLGIALVGLMRVGVMLESASMQEVCLKMAYLSLLLCFFNLLPIPPLDGSQVVRVLAGISYDAYYQFAQYGFVLLILIIQFVPGVGAALGFVASQTLLLIASCFGIR